MGILRKVEVIPYHHKWAILFAEEAKKLERVFGSEILVIYHIGSTAVPGLSAKPIIDMMPVVKDIRLVDQYDNEMKKIGYDPKGENGIKGRRYFQKGGDNRTHHVHIYQTGSEEIVRHLAFRDFLKEHQDIRESYSNLKSKLARQFPDDIESYINGKDLFVKEVEGKALQWYRGVMY